MTGTVITSQPERGFFFVCPVGGKHKDHCFAHARDWGGEVLEVGTVVEFESVQGERGPRAVPGVK